jgi:hypothetical protein
VKLLLALLPTGALASKVLTTGGTMLLSVLVYEHHAAVSARLRDDIWLALCSRSRRAHLRA